jgi:hypothetical protein
MYKIIAALVSAPRSQRLAMRAQLRHMNPGLFRDKNFQAKYEQAAKDVGNGRRLAAHRTACLQALAAKEQLVKQGKGNHKFISPHTPTA